MNVFRLCVALMMVDAGLAPPLSAVTWSPALGVPSLSAVDALLRRPLDEAYAAVLANGAVRPMKTCRDLLPLVDAGFSHLSPDDSTVAWQSFQVDVVRCSALKLLKQARPPSSSYLGWFTLSPAAILKLPAGVAPAFTDREMKAVARAGKVCKSWGAYDRRLRVTVEGQDGSLEAPDWSGHIHVDARGDLKATEWKICCSSARP